MMEELAEQLHEDRERLKRELNAAHQISKKYEDRYFECLDRIKRMKVAGDAMAQELVRRGLRKEIDVWIAAKEAKL